MHFQENLRSEEKMLRMYIALLLPMAVKFSSRLEVSIKIAIFKTKFIIFPTKSIIFLQNSSLNTKRSPRVALPLLVHLNSLLIRDVRPYLEFQNKWPFFNTKSSFSRGDSPLSLHFQQNIQNIFGIVIAISSTSLICDSFFRSRPRIKGELTTK